MNTVFWLTLLALGVGFNVTMSLRWIHAQHDLLAKLSRLSKKVDCVLDLLMIWSQTWGRHPDEVRVLLEIRLDKYTRETGETLMVVQHE